MRTIAGDINQLWLEKNDRGKNRWRNQIYSSNVHAWQNCCVPSTHSGLTYIVRVIRIIFIIPNIYIIYLTVIRRIYLVFKGGAYILSRFSIIRSLY